MKNLWSHINRKLILWVFGLFAGVVFVTATWIFFQIPSEKDIKGCITTRMYNVKLCPGSKTYVPLSRISKNLTRSIIVSEDANFWNHNGFDWDQLQSSAWENLEKGRFVRGGSTITQQLAKNLFLSKEKSLFRKMIEAFITVKIEKTLSKKEILERYLNVIEFGKGVYGVREASRVYFQKSPAELNVLESAFLTMLLPSPVRYAKSYHQKSLTPFARKRMKLLFDRLYAVKHLTSEQRNEAHLMLDWFLKDKAPPEVETEDADLELDFDEAAPASIEEPEAQEEEELSLDEAFADPVDGDVHREPAQDEQNKSL